jgi:hypothetical protein
MFLLHCLYIALRCYCISLYFIVFVLCILVINYLLCGYNLVLDYSTRWFSPQWGGKAKRGEFQRSGKPSLNYFHSLLHSLYGVAVRKRQRYSCNAFSVPRASPIVEKPIASFLQFCCRIKIFNHSIHLSLYNYIAMDTFIVIQNCFILILYTC